MRGTDNEGLQSYKLLKAVPYIVPLHKMVSECTYLFSISPFPPKTDQPQDSKCAHVHQQPHLFSCSTSEHSTDNQKKKRNRFRSMISQLTVPVIDTVGGSLSIDQSTMLSGSTIMFSVSSIVESNTKIRAETNNRIFGRFVRSPTI